MLHRSGVGGEIGCPDSVALAAGVKLSASAVAEMHKLKPPFQLLPKATTALRIFWRFDPAGLSGSWSGCRSDGGNMPVRGDGVEQDHCRYIACDSSDGSPPAPKASIPAHDPRFSALDANEDGYDTCKEFTHNDYDICKAYKASKLLAESIFYSPTVAVFKRPDPIPETIADAALGAAASLSLVIPVVGPAIFVGGSFASFACRVDLLNKAGSNAPDKFTLMKTDILAKLKEAQLVKFKSKLDTLLDVIQTRVDARDDIFNRVTSADYLVVLETFNILVSNAFNVTNAESYLLVMPKVLENQYCWADIDIEQAIVVLVPFLVQCMELRLVLAANLHDICKASADHQADADRYVTDFQVNLDFVRDTLAKVVKRMKEMTVTQRKQRRPHFDGKVKVPAKVRCEPMDWSFQ